MGGIKPAKGEVQWDNGWSKKLVSVHLCNSLQNLVNGRFGSLLGNAYTSNKDGFELDGTGDGFIVDSATAQSWNFGTDDFTIIIMARWETHVNNFAGYMSSGGFGSGQFMLRKNSGSTQFYGDNGSIIATVATQNDTVGAEVLNFVSRIGSTLTLAELNPVTGVVLVSASDGSAGGDLNAADSNAGLGQVNEEANRFFTGAIKWCYVWSDRGMTVEQGTEFVRDPFQIVKPAIPMHYFVPAAVGGADIRNHIIPAYMRMNA